MRDRPLRPSSVLALPSLVFAVGLMSVLAGCAAGPDFIPPTAEAPSDWTSWRSADKSLVAEVAQDSTLPPDWWRAFNDPILNDLEDRAARSSPDLQTAALHWAQAQAQRDTSAARQTPEVDANAQIARQRQSEYGASTRLFSAIGGNNPEMAEILGEPYTLYQTGLSFSWEVDLWGRIRRSVEAADATVTAQSALLDLARLTLSGNLAQAYLQLRATQKRIALTREDLALMRDALTLARARTDGGLNTHIDLEHRQAEIRGIEGQLPGLLAEEARYINQIALLTGEKPGALSPLLTQTSEPAPLALPDLAPGLPSEVARRRPDLRAAEARLHTATATLGVAKADLYPAVRLGGAFNLESYREETLFDWASRTTSIGPSLSLPLFDGGRRKKTVRLRTLEQKEAAVAYQKTVLQAWQEIDDSLTGYEAARQQYQALSARLDNSRHALDLAEARYKSGVSTYLQVIDSRRAWVQAARDLADSEAQWGVRFVAVNRAIGNTSASGS